VSRDAIDVAIRLHGQRKFAKEVEASAAELESLGVKGAKSISSFAKTSEKLKSFGRSWTRNISLPVAGLGFVAGKMAIDFHQAMSLVQTQAGASAKEAKFLESAVLRMSENSKFSATEMADALYRVRSAGFKKRDALGILEYGKNLATLGNSDFELTTKALTGAAKNLGTEKLGQVKRLAAEMNAIVGTGDMRMEELQDALSTGVLPSFVAAGLGMRDYGAALTVMTDRNIPAQVASTRLRTAISMLVPHTKKAEEALEGVGIQSEAMANVMRKKGLPETIKFLAEHLSALSPNKQNRVMIEAFGGAKSSATIELLVQNYEELFEKQNLIREGLKKMPGELKVAEKQPGTELEKAWHAIEVSLIHIGDELLPALVPAAHKFSSALTGVAHIFTGLSPDVQAAAAGFLLLTGPVASGLGYFASGAGKGLIVMAKLNREVSGFTSIFGSAMSAGQGPLRSFGMAFEGTGVQGALQTAKGFALSLGPAVAAYGIGNIVTSAVSGDWQDAGWEAGGAFAGGLAGAIVGGPLGAMLGIGIGSLGGELLHGLLEPAKKVDLIQERLKASSKGLKSAFDAEREAMAGLSSASKRASGAHHQVESASESLRHAERSLERIRSGSPGHAVAIARAEIKVANAVRGVTAAKRAQRKAEQLKGVDRTIAKESLRYLTLELRHRRNLLSAQKAGLLKQLDQSKREGQLLQEREPLIKRFTKVSGSLDTANKELSQTLDKASTQVGPKFAGFLRNASRQALEFGSNVKAAKASVDQLRSSLEEARRAIAGTSNAFEKGQLEQRALTLEGGLPDAEQRVRRTRAKVGGPRGKKQPKPAQALEIPQRRPRRAVSGDLGDRLEELLEIHVHSYLELDGKVAAESSARHTAKARARE
jgi:TP901 family phage tail tape measure protein